MPEPQEFQYASPAHQADTAIAGTWLFLTSETLFFGGLFFVWLILRERDPAGLALGVQHTNLTIGTLNTVVLLTSSCTYAFAVYRAGAGRGRAIAFWCNVTAALGVLFLVLKSLEWYLDIKDGLYPGASFALTGPHAGGAHMFWDLYWIATPLHGLHMTVGIVLVLWIARRARHGAFTRAYNTPVEVVGLYWSFVDVIWITLYPLLYLVARP